MDKRIINVNTKYSLDDTNSTRRKIAAMLIDGVDIGAFAPSLGGSIRITGKRIMDLALERLCNDLESAISKNNVPQSAAATEQQVDGEQRSKRKSSLDRLNESMGQQ